MPDRMKTEDKAGFSGPLQYFQAKIDNYREYRLFRSLLVLSRGVQRVQWIPANNICTGGKPIPAWCV